MIDLNPKTNDASCALDFLRAAAAQAVCVGHAVNVFGAGRTYAPHIGVMLFFVLSGFVIARTLAVKSKDPGYGLGTFMIERGARIYSAFLPALVLIAAVEILMIALGRPLPGNGTSWKLWLQNVLMLQGYPGDLGGPTYGSAGHLTSVAAEFHIYLFVGGLFFLAIGRNRYAALATAIAFATMPVGYFIAMEGTDRALFVLWLLGFGGFFAVNATKLDRASIPLFGAVAAGLAAWWLQRRTPGAEYALGSYPVFALCFLAVVLTTAQTTVTLSRPLLRRLVRAFADCSFSLFLIHFTLLYVIKAFWTGEAWPGALAGVVAANVLAFGFAHVTERRYRELAKWMQHVIAGRQRDKAPSAARP